MFTANFGPELTVIIRDVVELAGAAAAQVVLKDAIKFDILNPAVTDWIRNESGKLITLVNKLTKEAIREFIRTGDTEGKSLSQIVDAIRDHGLGLNRPQMAAMEKFKAQLEKNGVTGLTAQKPIDRLYNKMVKERATTIAHYESMKAMNRRWRQQIRQAVDAGLLDAQDWVAGWTYVHDECVCKKCESMEGKTRPVLGTYASGEYAGRKGPPAHVNCRCGEVLKRAVGANAVKVEA